MSDLTIEVPEIFLLTVAVYGNMGDGELPDLMASWARKKCIELGLGGRLVELQEERREELESRLRKVMGEKFVNGLKNEIDMAIEKLGKA